MPALVTNDHVMVERYWTTRMRNNPTLTRRPDIELVAPAIAWRGELAMVQRRLDTMAAASMEWKNPWRPELHVVKDDGTAFAYALKGATPTDWIFISSKCLTGLRWYAGGIAIRSALALSMPGPPDMALVQACDAAAFDAMVGYYLEHEIAHFTDGHLGYKEAVEITPEAEQALELGADTLAFQKLIDAELSRMRSRLAEGRDPEGCAIASTLTFLSILPPMRITHYLPLTHNGSPHPNSAFRQMMGVSMWANALSQERGVDALEMTMQCAQVVVCAFLERGNDADRAQAEALRAMLGTEEDFPFLRAADLRRVLYDDHVFTYGAALAARYAQLSPRLAPFRRGAPPPDVARHWHSPRP